MGTIVIYGWLTNTTNNNSATDFLTISMNTFLSDNWMHSSKYLVHINAISSFLKRSCRLE